MELSANLRGPPKAVKDAMSDESEVQTFEYWKNNAGRELHASFGEKTVYNSQRAIWRPPHTHELERVLVSAQQLDPAFDVKGCTWEDLLQHVDTAIELDTQKGKNNKLRGALRNSKADVQLLNSLVSLIPDEKGLGILRGGLSILFESWIQRIETREAVLKLLSDVIELFASAVAQRRVFADDEELRALLFDLYGVMLDAIRELISILIRTHKGSWIQRVRKQLPTHEAQRVEEIMTRIENCKTRIGNRIETLGLARNAATHKNTEAINREVQATRYHISAMEVDVRGMGQGLQDVYVQGQEINAQLHGIDASVQNVNANLEKYVEASVAKQFEKWKKEFYSGLGNMKRDYQENTGGIIQTFMYQFMGEKMYAEKLGWLHRPSLQQQNLNFQQIEVPIEQLIHVLNVDPTPMMQDIRDVLRQSNTMQADGLGKVQCLISKEQFRNWMSTSSLNVLLVDGLCREYGIGRTSPLSVFCASLTASLADSRANIVVHFLCAHHTRPEQDPVSGPSGLMRSLISQLLLYPGVETGHPVLMEQRMWNSVNSYDVTSLCALFEQVLVHLDFSRTVYCILDNISDYQSVIHGWSQEMLYIVQQMHKLAYGRRSGPPLKLFMTSANRTMDPSPMVNQFGGEYIALRTGNSDFRPTRGRAFEQDIRRVIQEPVDTAFLDPRGRRSFGRDLEPENTYVGRARSLGRY